MQLSQLAFSSFEGQRNNSTVNENQRYESFLCMTLAEIMLPGSSFVSWGLCSSKAILGLKILSESRVDCYWVRQFRVKALNLCVPSLERQREGAKPVLPVYLQSKQILLKQVKRLKTSGGWVLKERETVRGVDTLQDIWAGSSPCASA